MSRIEKLEWHHAKLQAYLKNLRTGTSFQDNVLWSFRAIVANAKKDGFTLKELFLVLTDDDFNFLEKHSIVVDFPELPRKRFDEFSDTNEVSQPSSKGLKLKIDPGTAPPEEIAKYLHLLDKLYKARGGSGLEFKPEDVGIKEREGVPS